MARIAGVNLPAQKHVWVGLEHLRHWPYPFRKVCEAAGVDETTRIVDLRSRKSSAFAPKSAVLVEGDPAVK